MKSQTVEDAVLEVIDLLCGDIIGTNTDDDGQVQYSNVDAAELDGWELRAAWDDFKLGLKHGNHFEKVAIVGNKRWQDLVAKLGSWFIAGEARAFTNMTDALAWLTDSEARG